VTADPTWIDIAKDVASVFALASGGAVAIYGVFRGFSRYEEAKLRVERESLDLQRRDRTRRLKFELASEIVDLFPKAEHAMRQVRSPTSTQTESEEADKFFNLSEYDKKTHAIDPFARLVAYRLGEHADTIDRLEELRPKFRILFGVDKPFEEVYNCFMEVHLIARTLRHSSDDFVNEFNKLVAGTSEDTITGRMRDAVTDIERLCAPTLRGDE
jgi:hypothetical protein